MCVCGGGAGTGTGVGTGTGAGPDSLKKPSTATCTSTGTGTGVVVLHKLLSTLSSPPLPPRMLPPPQFGCLFAAVWVPVWDCLVLFATVLGACWDCLGTAWDSVGSVWATVWVSLGTNQPTNQSQTIQNHSETIPLPTPASQIV